MIPLSIFEIQIESSFPLDYGGNPGSTIRGALYEALRLLYESGHEAQSFTDETNPVSWLMRMSDPNARGGENLPRPFAIRPPLSQQPESFGVTLFGKACKYSPLLFSALDAMQILGMGLGKWQFQINRIHQVHPITHVKKLIIEGGRAVDKIDDSPSSELYFQAGKTWDTKQIWIDFLTPTRIIHKDALSHKPIFAHWVNRLLSRIWKISELYADEPIQIPFNELRSLAWTIQLVEDKTRWHDLWSHSSKSKHMHPTSGYVGRVAYSGDLKQFLPYLMLGESLQVGKSISKGCGWYRLLYRPE